MFYKPAVYWMLLAFAVRLVVCLAIHIYSLEAGFEGFYPLASGHDDGFYWQLADEIQSGSIPKYLPNFYPFILAGLFSMTRQDLLIGKLLNVIVGSLTVYFGVLIARDLSNSIKLSQRDLPYSANLTGLFLTFYPSAIFYSTQLVKDPLLIFFGIFNLYIYIAILKFREYKLSICWIFSLIALYSFRPYSAVALVISLLVYLMFIWKVKLQRKLLVLILALIPCALVPYFFGEGLFAMDRIIPSLNTDDISIVRERAYSTGGSSTGISIDYTNPVNFIFTYGQSYMTAMFGPLPWQLRSLVQIISLPEAIGMWFLLFHLWKYRFIKGAPTQAKEERLLLVFSLILIGIIALFSDNIGANTRLRILPWISFMIYAFISFAKKRALQNTLNFKLENQKIR